MDEKSELQARIKELMEKVAATQAESAAMREHTSALLKLQDDFEAERRKTATFLLDKTLPVLVAIVGGISYVLIERKLHLSWQIRCYRIAGFCLSILILISLLRAWLEPIFLFNFKMQMLAIAHRQERPPEPLISKYSELIEGALLVLVALLLVVSLSLLGIATMLNPQ